MLQNKFIAFFLKNLIKLYILEKIYNIEKGFYSFYFYVDWDKIKNLFPRVEYILRFYYDKSKNFIDESGINHIGNGCHKINLINYKTGEKEKVIEVSFD